MQGSSDLGRSVGRGCAVFALVLLAYAAALAIFDSALPVFDAAAPLHLHRLTRINLVLAAITAFTSAATLFEIRATARDLRALQPILTLGADDLAALRRELASPPRQRLLAVQLLGGLSGLAIDLWAPTGAWRDQIGDTADGVRLLLMMVLFALLGARGYASIRSSRLFSQLGQEHVRVDLFDPEPRKVFARRGLRLSLNWFVGSAIASLLFLDAGTPVIVGAVITATLGLGVLSLVLPMRGIHVAVRAAKQTELRRSRAAIAAGGESLFGTPSPAGPRLEALIAFEARVESVREWPIDGSTLWRFCALALLATGSWVGGAIVERAVSSLLG